MRNNLQNDVKAEKSIEQVSKLDLSGSVSTTLSMGKVNVKFSRRVLPYTKAIVGDESLVYLSPMVRPTYGKLFYKTWQYFIACSDLWKPYQAMMTKQPISVNGQMRTFTREPHAENRGLASFAFNGAKCSLYVSDSISESNPINLGVNRSFYIKAPVNQSYRTLINTITQRYYYLDSGKPRLKIGLLLGGPTFWDNSNDLDFVSGNLSWETFTDLTSYEGISVAGLASGFDYTTVPIDKADYKIFTLEDIDGDKVVCCWAFRFSSWGKWYSSLLRALGYGFLGSDIYKHKSLLPLLGTFFAYWNTFGLNQWQNIETTYCGRIKSAWDLIDDYDPWKQSATWSLFKSFILDELGAMWVTENADYIAAHLPQPVIGQDLAGWSGVVDVNGATIPITQSTGNASRRSNEPNRIEGDGHAKINSVEHGALDSRLIMRLYKVTNRNTPLGRKIADLAKAAGLGFYMMYCKTDYLGETSIPLDISKVTSQSDTFNPVTEDGMPLGDYAGRGIGYQSNDKKLYHYTENEGFWICLDAVTCDSGYSQGVDTTLERISRDDKFQADYDGFGLVVHDKDILVGSDEVSTVAFKHSAIVAGDPVPEGRIAQCSAQMAFGFAPIYSEYKVGRSILNGGFAYPSERNTYLPFVLDKVILSNIISVIRKTEDVDTKTYRVGLSLPVENVPQSGTAWRYLSRYFWLSNLNRIFVYQGKSLPQVWQNFETYADVYEYIYNQPDNYILLSEIWFKAWSRCLPIEETWGTLDPDRRELAYFERT